MKKAYLEIVLRDTTELDPSILRVLNDFEVAEHTLRSLVALLRRQALIGNKRQIDVISTLVDEANLLLNEVPAFKVQRCLVYNMHYLQML